MVKKLLVLVTAIVAAGMLAACSQPQATTTPAKTTTSTALTATLPVGSPVPGTTTTSATITTTTTRQAVTTTAAPTATAQPPTANPGVGLSRNNPAPVGTALTAATNSIFWGSGQVRVTLLQSVRGVAAMQMLTTASQFNPPPQTGYEYIVAKIRFEFLSTSFINAQYNLTSSQFLAVSSYGSDYVAPPLVVSPDPKLGGNLPVGTAQEGWVTFSVSVSDSVPTMAFSRDTSGNGGLWWRL